MADQNYILEVEHLDKYFGALHATQDVSFKVPYGQMRAIIGPNGAGKSTLMDLICNKTPLSGGKVFFKGEDITLMAPSRIVHKGMCKCFQITQIFPNLTVFENVQMACINMHRKGFSFRPVKDSYLKEDVIHILHMVGIEDKMNEISGVMSYGDQRRLDIAIALAMHPELLILDEPAAGVAREEAYKLMDLIRALACREHMTMLFIEHDMQIVFNYADEITVLSNGKLMASAPPEDIRNDEFVKAAYLGGGNES